MGRNAFNTRNYLFTLGAMDAIENYFPTRHTIREVSSKVMMMGQQQISATRDYDVHYSVRHSH